MAASGDDNYKLFYWKGFSGRAEPVFLLLEDGKIPYEYVCEDAKAKMNSESSYSSHAFPQLEKGGFVLSQTTAIMKYLGEVHGYDGETPEERSHVLQVASNASDIWVEGYGTRKDNKGIGMSSDSGKAFWTGEGKRGEMWLQRLETNLNATEGDYFFGNKITYADFCVMNALEVLRWMYGEHFETEYNKCPGLKNFETVFYNRPNIKKFREENPMDVLYDGVSAGKLPSWEE